MKWTWNRIMEFPNRIVILKNQPLTVKLLVFSAILVVIPMLVVGVFSFYRSSIELESQTRQHSFQVIEQVKAHMEYYVQDFEITALKIVNHPDMADFLRMRTGEEVQESHIRKRIQSLLKNAAYSRPDISNITVILDDVQVIDVLGDRNREPASGLKHEYWYPSVPNNGSPFLISRVISTFDREEPVISLVKRVHSPQTLQPVGLLIIDINFKRIQELSDKVTIGKNGAFYILDSEGHYVYHPNRSMLGKKAELSNLGFLFTRKSGSLVWADHHEKKFLTFSYSSHLGWWFVTSVPYEDVTQGIGHIGETITWTVIITLIIAYLLGGSFAASLVRPIRRLQQFMKKVEVGNFSERVTVESHDEIGQLSHGFNKMVERLSKLIEEVYFSKLRETEMALREKEMELKVLQSQINPHFLYNALETIRGMALDKDMLDVAKMASSLGILLRYNLRNHSPTVALREEIKFCEVYLQIQQFRFEERFEYSFDIPEWAMDLLVPRFFLQPLVENCFIHGIGLGAEKTHIQISAQRETDSSFLILVADTGAGMPEEVLNNIRKNLETKDATQGGPNIGIVNVHRRIAHLFGAEYGLTIQSKVGCGTRVDIRLPMIKEKRMEDPYEQHHAS